MTVNVFEFCDASGWIVSLHFVKNHRHIEDFCISSCSLPASIFEMSRISLISVSRCLPAFWIALEVGRARSCLVCSGHDLQQIAIADDGIERRAEFVAHGGEHHALGLMSLLRDRLGMAQRFLSLFGCPCPQEDGSLGADAGEHLQIFRRKTSWRGAGIHLDEAQQLVVGQERRASCSGWRGS